MRKGIRPRYPPIVMTYINKDEASSLSGRGPLAVYRERIASGDLKNDPDQARVVDRLDQPPAPGSSGVQYPGQFEADNRARHASHIEVSDASWGALQGLASAMGVPMPVPSAAQP